MRVLVKHSGRSSCTFLHIAITSLIVYTVGLYLPCFTHGNAVSSVHGDTNSATRSLRDNACAVVRAQSHTFQAPVSNDAARMLIHIIAAHNASASDCPLFLKHFPNQTQQYLSWKPFTLPYNAPALSAIKCQSDEFCDQLYPAEETRRMFSSIFDHQHPRDCSRSKFLVITREWYNGLGSNIHVKAWMLLVALSQGRVLIDRPGINWPQTNGENCPAKDWTCYFAPMTHCTLPIDWERTSEPLQATYSQGREPQFAHSHVDFELVSGQLQANGSTIDGFFARKFLSSIRKPSSWWMAHATAYLTRPNKRTLNVVCTYWNCITRNAITPLRPMAAVFIRSGDKVTEAPFRNTSEHMAVLADFVEQHPDLRPKQVYIGTDNADILSKAVEDYNKTWALLWFGYPRSSGGATTNQVNERAHSPQIELQILMTLTDLFLSVVADIFVGTLTSNHARLVDELRKVHGKARLPYLTPEGSLDTWP